MAFARPSTPSASPRKRAPLASSRPASPAKTSISTAASTANPSPSRPSSRTNIAGGTSRSMLPASSSARSSVSGIPTRPSGRTTRSSVASSLNPSLSYQDALAGVSASTSMNGSARRESDVPRRKAGFGPPATPMRSAGPSAQTVFENEEGGAGLPLADADGVAVREDGIASGETTETEEDDRDGKQENVVVCLRYV